MHTSRDIQVLLHNIRSNHNVGSIFRSADGAGVTCLYLTGYTPAPRDRFGRKNEVLAKVALGAQEHVPWSEERDIHALIRKLKKDGFLVVAVEQDARAVPYTSFVVPEKVTFIFGPEVEGLGEDVRIAADVMVEIPMHGTKESLNVSVAAGIMLFRARHADHPKT